MRFLVFFAKNRGKNDDFLERTALLRVKLGIKRAMGWMGVIELLPYIICTRAGAKEYREWYYNAITLYAKRTGKTFFFDFSSTFVPNIARLCCIK